MTMPDQASTLRTAPPPASTGPASRRAILCIAVASGKGGVGKTFFSVNLAVALHSLGRRVLLVDADLGLPNADIVLGAAPEMTLEDCLFRGANLADIVVSTPFGPDLLAANSGAREMVSLGEARLSLFVEELVEFAARYDVLLFDCASGINSSVTAFIAAVPQSIIVMQPEPTSLMDAYALLKVITQEELSPAVSLILNGVREQKTAERILTQLTSVTRRYLDRELDCIGTIPHCTRADAAMRARQPLVTFDKEDPASLQLQRIARRILQQQQAATPLKSLNAGGLLEGMLQRASTQ